MDLNGNDKKMIMKKNIQIFSLIILTTLIFSQCSENEVIPTIEKNKVPMTFTALLDIGDETKTTLGDVAGNKRSVLWMNKDSIGVSSDGGDFDKYIYTGDDEVAKAHFEGESSIGTSFYGIYPYNDALNIESGIATLLLPETQTYKEDNFDSGSFPMVSKNSEQVLHFKNLCGILQLNLKGEAKITSIRITASVPISGKGSVDMSYETAPDLKMNSSSDKSVVLNCGEGVVLKKDVVTPFNIVLPEGIYSSLTIKIIGEGKLMTKLSPEITIKRSSITPSAPLEFVDDPVINLSDGGTANCYIATPGGRYSFFAGYKGRSTEEVAFSSACLLWRTGGKNKSVSDSVISTLTYNLTTRVVSFTAVREGNAVIAVKGADGVILWSWHIWVTDYDPDRSRQTYASGVKVMDRNLGALSATPGDVRALGLYYQLGRKDPFRGASSINSNTFEETTGGNWAATSGIDTHTKNPMTFIIDNTSFYSWGGLENPCPKDWRAFEYYDNPWSGFPTTNTFDYLNRGMTFGSPYSSSDSWFPMAGYIVNTTGLLSGVGTMGKFFTSRYYDDFYDYYRSVEYDNNGNVTITNHKVAYNPSVLRHGFSVRCCRESTTATVSTGEVSDITFSTATVTGNITNDGGQNITAKGAVWSTSQNPTIDLSTKTNEGAGTGMFSSTLKGLNQNTTYYVRTYVTNASGTSYGQQKSFITLADPEVTALNAFYNATGGANWTNKTNWGTSENKNRWYGISVNSDGKVTKIELSNNNLKGDVSSILSTLSSLETLIVSKNQLSSIDIAPNTNLTKLDCSFNSLTSLEVSSNAALKDLNCSSNSLTALDLKLNTSLSRLSCFDNNISMLDIRNLSVLEDNYLFVGNQKNSAYIILFMSETQKTSKWDSSWSALENNTRVTPCASTLAIATSAVTKISSSTAVSGGNIISLGEVTVSAKGVCWSKTENPTIDIETKTSDGTGPDAFISKITGLSPKTTYYVRAYVQLSDNTVIYGQQNSFKTLSSGTNEGSDEENPYEW